MISKGWNFIAFPRLLEIVKEHTDSCKRDQRFLVTGYIMIFKASFDYFVKNLNEYARYLMVVLCSMYNLSMN